MMYPFSSRLLRWVAAGFVASGSVTAAFATDQPIPHPLSVNVRIRTIAGSGEVAPSAETVSLQIDSRIEDLKEKLQKFHYSSYALLGSQEENITMEKKKVLKLAKGQTLILRPLYVSDNRVGMWLKWVDANGVKLLDTRMHFSCEESMLTGTEQEDHSGIIVAIRVSPIGG